MNLKKYLALSFGAIAPLATIGMVACQNPTNNGDNKNKGGNKDNNVTPDPKLATQDQKNTLIQKIKLKQTNFSTQIAQLLEKVNDKIKSIDGTNPFEALKTQIEAFKNTPATVWEQRINSATKKDELDQIEKDFDKAMEALDTFVNNLTQQIETLLKYDSEKTADDNPNKKEESSNNSPTTPGTSNSANESKYIYTYDANNDYYKPLEGKSGKELFDAILALQKSKLHPHSGAYNDLVRFYVESKAFKDLYYEKDGSLLDIYSENPNGKDPYEYTTYQSGNYKKEGDSTNREHLIPQSWFNKEEPIRSDSQFVWPTDSKVNGIRSNYPHDVVKTVSETSENGSKLGTNADGQKVFEPIDAFKGDVARAYLYFAATYSFGNINGLSIYMKNSIFDRNDTFGLPLYWINLYVNWDKKDPVDMFDITRNNESAKYESLRNPFIDYPDLYNNLFIENPKPFVNKGILISAKLNPNYKDTNSSSNVNINIPDNNTPRNNSSTTNNSPSNNGNSSSSMDNSANLDQYADAFKNGYQIDQAKKEELIQNLNQNHVIRFDYKNNSLIILTNNSKPDWKQETNILRFATFNGNLPRGIQMANEESENGDTRFGSNLSYTFTDNKLTIKFKVAKYKGKNKAQDVSNTINTLEFTLS
ncbi:hypothetical protein GE118_02360 [Mycoplasma sp. NEAQ87857]|uniref:endonuclease n=1 Tax=Mycoplasma sp. NEAQ87857 TaxID=2683967 RepID=UPI001317FDBE|nr:endonuclease [Mycoplasma sp. NEAQ87857]QGZ97637.1 hypothetical protein GE118_02360 [Mycoplasma sp. NEAQ87857]